MEHRSRRAKTLEGPATRVVLLEALYRPARSCGLLSTGGGVEVETEHLDCAEDWRAKESVENEFLPLCNVPMLCKFNRTNAKLCPVYAQTKNNSALTWTDSRKAAIGGRVLLSTYDCENVCCS